MRILITDSGVGGLSVVAYAERFLRERGYGEPVQLSFANAAPANDYGYNSMPSREVKIETLDRFLRSVAERYSPDLIYVACNTLSVLLPDTPFFREGRLPMKGIVETGVSLILRELASVGGEAAALIFGTQTTIDAGTYPRLLVEQGVSPERIVSQACPGLADTISEDREGTRSRQEIRGWVTTALEKMVCKDVPVVACLACTHYGYRRQQFVEALAEAGAVASVVNPNESAVDDLFPGHGHASPQADVEVEFITRYALPSATVEALSWYLRGIAPRTVDAMQHYVHVPDLF